MQALVSCSSRDQCTLLPNVQNFENHCFIYWVYFLIDFVCVVSSVRVNLVHITSSWL